MKIGIDASRANEKQKTGTEWVAYYLIQEFKKIADPKDQYILYSKESLRGDLAELPKNFSNKVLSWPPVFLWTQLRLAWEMLINPPDVLFVPAHTIPIISPKKTYTILHDIGFEHFPDLYSKKEIGPNNIFLKKIFKLLIQVLSLGKFSNNELDYHRWSAQLAVKKAAKLITISEFSKQEIQKRFKTLPNKITVIPNAFNSTFKKIENTELLNLIKKKYNLQKPFFLYTGRLERKKNTGRVVEAYYEFLKKYSKDYDLILIGKPGYGYQETEIKIKQWGIGQCVKRLGWLPNDEMPIIMSLAQAFIFPTLYEGFGMPILEAMNCGIPVITSRSGANEEIAGGAALIVDPYKTDEISDAMNKIITNTYLRNKLIADGLNRAKQFSWNKAAQQILKLMTGQ